jgi:hypothetical protein
MQNRKYYIWKFFYSKSVYNFSTSWSKIIILLLRSELSLVSVAHKSTMDVANVTYFRAKQKSSQIVFIRSVVFIDESNIIFLKNVIQ